MKASIAGILVSIPLPQEAFCAWKKRVLASSSPTNDGNTDDRNSRTDGHHSSRATAPTADKAALDAPTSAPPPYQDRSRTSLPPAYSSTKANAGGGGATRNEVVHRLNNTGTTESPALRKGSTGATVGDSSAGTSSGDQERRGRNCCSSLPTPDGPATPPLPPPPPPHAPAPVAAIPLMVDGAGARENNPRTSLGQDPRAARPGEYGKARETVGGDGDPPAFRSDVYTVVESEIDGTLTPALAAANEAGGRSGAAGQRTARGGAAGARPGPASHATADKRTRITPGGERANKNAALPAEEQTIVRKESVDGGAGEGTAQRAVPAAWGTGDRVNDDRAANAAASAIAGVGWRNLRRDTVTALVRQLGR